MKTVTVSTRSKRLNALLKQAQKENIILRAADGAEFILAEIDDFNREIELTRQNKKLMKYLEHAPSRRRLYHLRRQRRN